MKLTLLQTDIAWGAPEMNTARAEALMDSHPGSDLYLLPEMFSTGFATSPEGIAEQPEGHTVAWMRRTAEQRRCALCGSLAIREGDRFYNRLYFVKPDGTVETYDKRHLFTYGGEHLHYTAGTSRLVVEWQGVRILPLICYDLRFPVWSRNRGEYDLLIYVANWPVPRRRVWDTLLRARAIENQCYVAAVNRVGSDPSCTYNGGSCLIDAYGRDTVSCPDDLVCAVTAELDLERLSAFRAKFPVLQDGDKE